MILEVKNGTYSYPGTSEPILNDVSFHIHEKEVLTILGKNGIGKTTLLKCVTGVFRWDKGEVALDGKKQEPGKMISEMAYVPQAHKLSYPYTVEDVVLMGRVRHMGPLSIPGKEDKEIAWNAMELAGVTDYAKRPSTKLSGGQLQLVYIARALASEPKILVMDEPESHLDFKNQFFILEMIEKLVEEKGLSCIINTHYPDHALRISDKSLMLGNNKYIFDKAEKVITEENVAEYFGVQSSIGLLSKNGKAYPTFSVLDAIR